ncbi:MAG: 4-hydroxythreonine-4-phosphate dehydrogenase PdxA [Pseudobdellovibrionaceae bacterium]
MRAPAIKKVLITTGDVDGVGLEVSIKALQKLGPQKKTQFFLYRSLLAPAFRLSRFDRIQVLDLQHALQIKPNPNQIIEIVRTDSPACWVEEAGRACFQKKADSIVTAPLSKQEIQAAGFSDIGHTDIFKRVTKEKTAFMAFMGPQFNVLLITGHIPTSQVEKKITPALLKKAFQAAEKARSLLPSSQAKKPLAVLGLNPHAGDQGLIGQFDEKILKPYLQRHGKALRAQGPLVPDVAFLPENWNKYSVYLAQYHDQGLIPFKMIHGFDAGVHLTLGLPIKRSSVDHGTAKDIFGQNKANPGSMIEALRWGVRLAHKG